MFDEYKKLGCKKGTFKVELELPDEFKRDFTEKGMFDNKNKMSECFDRILSAIRCKDVSSIATYEREICEVMKIAMGNARIKSEFDSLETHINERIREAVEDLKHDFIEKTRDKITKLQTYKMFPYEDTVYVERDEVLRIFEKYKAESEEEE